MRWPFKKNVESKKVISVEPRKVRVVKLSIFFTDSSRSPGWVSVRGSKKGRVFIFRDFYKWYFGRPQSDFYIFRWDSGEMLLSRKDISHFELVEYEDKE